MIQHHRVGVFSDSEQAPAKVEKHLHALSTTLTPSEAAELELVKENVAHNVPLIAALFRETVFFSFFFSSRGEWV